MRYLAVFVLVVVIAVGFTGCGNKQPNTASESVVEAQSSNAKVVGFHLCGSPTKAGGQCKRRVSNVHGLNARCWQHIGK